MSLSPAIIDAMLAAGCTAEQLAAVIKADLADREGRVAEKRQKDAERQRRHRERNAVSRDVTVTDSDSVTDPSLSPAPFLSPQTPQTNPHPHTHPDKQSRARKGTEFPMLDCTDAETWADFLRNRKTKRLPNTASAHRKLETDLAAMVARTGWPPGKLFAACVERGWGAIYDPRDKNDGISANRANSGQRAAKSGVAAALDRRLGLDGPSAAFGRSDVGAGAGDSLLAITGPETLR